MRDKTLYVVTGYMRTGTSMMMKALEAGGLSAIYDKSRDDMKDRHKDEYYDPNYGGLYELERAEYRKPGFPRNYEGKLIKCLGRGVPRMAVMEHGIRVVQMRRDPEEIRQSFDAFFGKQLPAIDVIQMLETAEERIRNRRDVISCHIFQFRDVIDDPDEYFEILCRDGWPINIEKAISTVDPALCRFRFEELTVGVL